MAVVLMFLLPAAELAALFGAVLLNQWVTGRVARLRRFEPVTLVLLWYVVLLIGGYVGS